MKVRYFGLLWLGVLGLFLLVACGGGDRAESAGTDTPILVLPTLEPVELSGAPLKVVATTSIIGDVVGQVGGSAIELTTLMAPGQDPHSFEPAARDLTAVAEADLVFVNGWDLEEGLVDSLAAIAGDVPVVPISARIQPRVFSEDDEDEADHVEEEHNEGEHDGGEHAHGAIDPHVWLALDNVSLWVDNVVTMLGSLDPANESVFATNGAVYQLALAEMADYAAAGIARIPPERRLLVTNHDALGYLADAYDFEILGTVIPAFSTLAEPSASDLAALIEVMAAHDLCTVFSETTVADTLAQTVSGELANCAEVQVLPLYTGSLGPAGSPA
ncbi:MAG: zinc ABC transporter substrate-binding protein, partial [Anaerolineales bacterium]|nr:zinc ABC transporter substrate-binding protein [Anaerolineales bacterium]